jgi:hypothetical protein
MCYRPRARRANGRRVSISQVCRLGINDRLPPHPQCQNLGFSHARHGSCSVADQAATARLLLRHSAKSKKKFHDATGEIGSRLELRETGSELRRAVSR